MITTTEGYITSSKGLRDLRYFGIFLGFHWILWDLLGFLGFDWILWDLLGFFGILLDIMWITENSEIQEMLTGFKVGACNQAN